HPTGTKLPVGRPPGGHTIARTVALARIFLDNIPHVRVLANYMDRKLLQAVLASGADDVGGTSLDERIARAAGAPDDHRFTSTEELSEFLAAIDLEAALVNSIYQPAVTAAPESARQATPLATDAERLSAAQAISLHDDVPFQQLGALAHQRRLAVVDPATATFVLDRNISITNVCEAGCKFCAFHVDPGSDDAFVLSIPEIVAKVAEAVELGATQIMLQGGLNPQLDLAFYERMLSAIKGSADVC
ncbi:MAG: radical SAM protein, partial [Planctomycetota bacterium]